MWTLIVIAMAGGTTASTHSTLEQCQLSLVVPEGSPLIRDAFCRNVVGDIVWIYKGGYPMPFINSDGLYLEPSQLHLDRYQP